MPASSSDGAFGSVYPRVSPVAAPSRGHAVNAVGGMLVVLVHIPPLREPVNPPHNFGGQALEPFLQHVNLSDTTSLRRPGRPPEVSIYYK